MEKITIILIYLNKIINQKYVLVYFNSDINKQEQKKYKQLSFILLFVKKNKKITKIDITKYQKSNHTNFKIIPNRSEKPDSCKPTVKKKEEPFLMR